MRNTSFTHATGFSNTWNIFGSLANSFTFTNLQKLSIFRFMDFEAIFKNGFEAIMYMGLTVIFIAAVQYGIVYWVTYLVFVAGGNESEIS